MFKKSLKQCSQRDGIYKPLFTHLQFNFKLNIFSYLFFQGTSYIILQDNTVSPFQCIWLQTTSSTFLKFGATATQGVNWKIYIQLKTWDSWDIYIYVSCLWKMSLQNKSVLSFFFFLQCTKRLRKLLVHLLISLIRLWGLW